MWLRLPAHVHEHICGGRPANYHMPPLENSTQPSRQHSPMTLTVQKGAYTPL
jgi:hypothetical protein